MLALGCFIGLALILTIPPLLGWASFGPESALDRDPLYRVGEPPKPPPFGDQTRAVMDLPRDLTFSRGLHAAQLRKWNPYTACGSPLWAEQGGPFFPLKLPFYLAPSPATYELFVGSRLVVAALGAYCLARRRGLGVAGAIAAGAGLELSGSSLALLGFGAASPYCLFPWALLGAQAIADSRSARALAGAAIALGIAGHGGHPTLILVVFLGFACALVGHAIAAWRRPVIVLQMAVLGVAAAVLGLALAAPSLLPFTELVSHGSSYKDRFIGAVSTLQSLVETRSALPISLFTPALVAVLHPVTMRLLLYSLAIGMLGVLVAVVGILRRGLDASLIVLMLVGIAIATNPPGFGWLRTAPIVRLIMPDYAWILVVVPLTQALGAGIEAVTGDASAKTVRNAFLLLLIGSSSLFFIPHALQWLGRVDLHDLFNSVIATPAGQLRAAIPPLVAAAVLAAVLTLRRTRWRPRLAPMLVALIVLEQMLTAVAVVWNLPSAVLASPPSPAVAFLQRQMADGNSRLTVVPYEVGHPLTSMYYGLPDVRGLSPLPIFRYMQYLTIIADRSVNFTKQTTPRTTSALLDLAAVRFIVMPRADQSPPPPTVQFDPATRLAYADERVLVYENLMALPRVRIAHKFGTLANWGQARNQLQARIAKAIHAPDLPDADTVYIEPDAEGQFPAALADGTPGTERVTIVDQSNPDRLVVSAELQAPGLVVVADTFYPGWEASIDGTPTAIYPADLLFRAVMVPAGSHRIEFRYEPQPFRLGVYVFLAAAVVTGLLAVRRPRARRAARPDGLATAMAAQ